MSSDSFAMEDSSWSISACSGQPAKTAQSSSRFGPFRGAKRPPQPKVRFILFHQFCLPKQHHLSCHCSIFLPGSPSSSVKPPLSTIDLSHFRSENRIGAKGKRLRKNTPGYTTCPAEQLWDFPPWPSSAFWFGCWRPTPWCKRLRARSRWRARTRGWSDTSGAPKDPSLNMALLVRVLKDGEMNKHQIFGEDKI